MRFLIDASLPRSTARCIQQRGHHAIDVRDVGPTLALDPAVAAYAKANSLVLITGDFDFADVRQYPPVDYAGIIVIDRPPASTIADVIRLVESVLDSSVIMAALPGRLAIVDPHRVRIRPALPIR